MSQAKGPRVARPWGLEQRGALHPVEHGGEAEGELGRLRSAASPRAGSPLTRVVPTSKPLSLVFSRSERTGSGLEAHESAQPLLHPWVRKTPGEGDGGPPQCSCLENPPDRGLWWLQSMGRKELGTTERFSLSLLKQSRRKGCQD